MAKLQKSIEGLGLKSAAEEDSKRENANIDGNTAMGTMLQFGSTISRAFTEAYLMKKNMLRLIAMVIFIFMIWTLKLWVLLLAHK